MTIETSSRPTSYIRATKNKGVGFQFENGLYVSIQFGPGNYGTNYDLDYDQWMCHEIDPVDGEHLPASRSYRDIPPADKVEIAVIDHGSDTGEWAELDTGDTVVGRQSVADVMNILVLAQAAKDLQSFQMAYWTAYPDRRPVEKTDE